jgi:hypothetical protein
VRPDGVREILAYLLSRDVESGRELDVPHVIAAEVDVHQPRHELVGVRVPVVLDALQERVGAVADADDRNTHFVLRSHFSIPLSVLLSHGFLPSVGATRNA